MKAPYESGIWERMLNEDINIAYKRIMNLVETIPEAPAVVKREVFTSFVDKIYKRTT